MTKDKTLKIANDIAIGVDVTKDGTHVIATRLRPDGVKVVMYSQFHPLVQQNEFKPDWDEKLALTEEVIRLSKRIEELEAQPEQEPWPDEPVGHIAGCVHPPQRIWVGLTKKEFQETVEGLEDLEDCWVAIEAKLKEKNVPKA